MVIIHTKHTETQPVCHVHQSSNQNRVIQRHMSQTNQRRMMAETRLSVHVYDRQRQTIQLLSYAYNC